MIWATLVAASVDTAALGRVTVAVCGCTKVVLKDPAVNRLPARVMVKVPLLTPVPPLAPGTMPVREAAAWVLRMACSLMCSLIIRLRG